MNEEGEEEDRGAEEELLELEAEEVCYPEAEGEACPEQAAEQAH